MKDLHSQISTEDDVKGMIERLRLGDQQAFEKIYHTNHKKLYFIALRYLKDPDLAADVLQDVFVKLWTKRETLDPSQDLGGFLFVLLKNKVLNTIRDHRSVVLKQIELSSQKQVGKNDLEDRFYNKLYKSEFDAVVAKLPRKRRLIFKLKVFKGLDNPSVAAKLNISVNTVKVQYQRATKQVLDSLKNLLG